MPTKYREFFLYVKGIDNEINSKRAYFKTSLELMMTTESKGQSIAAISPEQSVQIALQTHLLLTTSIRNCNNSSVLSGWPFR